MLLTPLSLENDCLNLGETFAQGPRRCLRSEAIRPQLGGRDLLSSRLSNPNRP